MTVIDKIKSSPFLKHTLLRFIKSQNDYRPRFWVRLLINPFVHRKGKGTIVRNSTRLDVFPYNKFEVGQASLIEDFATINNGVGEVIIGKHSIVGLGNVVIGPVEIGDHVMFAANVVVSGLNHSYKNISVPPALQKVITNKIYVSDNVWIGANSVITAGVFIGKNAVVAAGSVVTKNVPPFSLVAGNPAKVLKQYDFETCTWERIVK